jgi:hypothetical protein
VERRPEMMTEDELLQEIPTSPQQPNEQEYESVDESDNEQGNLSFQIGMISLYFQAKLTGRFVASKQSAVPLSPRDRFPILCRNP